MVLYVVRWDIPTNQTDDYLTWVKFAIAETITVPGVEQETFRLNGSITKQLGKALGFDYLEASPRNSVSGSFGVGFFGIMGSGEFLGQSPNDVVRGRNSSYPSAFTRMQGGWYPVTEISESTFNVRLYEEKATT